MSVSPQGRKAVAKRVIGIVIDVVFVLFFLLCMFVLVMSVMSKRSADGAMRLFGYEMRIVMSSSMEKCDATDVSGYDIKDIPVKSLVVIEAVPEDGAQADEWYSSLAVGDVLTFRYVYVAQETITHRIVDISAKQTGGYIITLEGDNKAQGEVIQQVIDTSETDSPNYIIGKVTFVSFFLGLLITAVKSTLGIVLIVIVPCAIIIILEVIRIVDAVGAGKREKLVGEQLEKDREIAELKRQLALASGQPVTAEQAQSSPSSACVGDAAADSGSFQEVSGQPLPEEDGMENDK